MKKICFENGQGKVEMFLGGAGPVRVTALSGLGNPVKKYDTVSFAGKNGQKTLSSVAQPRTIIISGDVKEKSVVKNMLKVLDEPGWLHIDFGDKKKKIYCNQVEFEDGLQKGDYMNFILSLTADGVYFIDEEQTHISVFSQEDIILNEIVFPCMFSVKKTEAIVENFGEVNVEPVITICNYYDEGNSITGSITILNNTTKQKIELNTDMEENEVITIDVENRKVTSSTRGNITHVISNDTYLNKFWLCPGKNFLKATHSNLGEEITVSCSYFSNYREGLY